MTTPSPCLPSHTEACDLAPWVSDLLYVDYAFCIATRDTDIMYHWSFPSIVHSILHFVKKHAGGMFHYPLMGSQFFRWRKSGEVTLPCTKLECELRAKSHLRTPQCNQTRHFTSELLFLLPTQCHRITLKQSVPLHVPVLTTSRREGEKTKTRNQKKHTN